MWYTWISEHIGLNALLGLDGVPGWLMAAEVVLCIVAGYLCGSINSAIIISKRLYGKDIRAFGSGNAGTTNMLRTFGKKAALFTLLGDMAKSALAVLLGALIFGGAKGAVHLGSSEEGAYLAGLFCVLGHIAPVFYRFKGGKGVLAAATMILLLDPVVFLFVLGVFVLTVLMSRYVSMGSVAAAFLYPGFTYAVHQYMNNGVAPAIFKMGSTAIIALLVIFMHRENLNRVFHGTESKLSFKKKPEEDDDDDDDDDE